MGPTDDFAVEGALADDPDGGRRVDPDTAASRGSLRGYVGGRETTAAPGPRGEDPGGAWGYLLPVLEGVAEP
ncbi:MAG: hypothetical protein IT376_03740 [Polyangiaceae bacterium]|nr:hypothetical protein [Polyangiaceae bacterium]